MLNWTPWHRRDDAPRRTGAAPVAVAVSCTASDERILPDEPCGARVVTAAYADLRDTLERHDPAVVIVQAMTPRLDALDVANALAALRFRGRLVVMGSGLPSLRMVRDEIAAACPGLRVEALPSPASGASLLRAV